MTLSALGILSAAGGGAAAGDYELIESSIVSGTSTSSVVFSSLGTYSSTYKHLQIRYIVRNSNASDEIALRLRLNGDATTANYTFHQLAGTGSSVVSTGNTNQGFLALTNQPGSTSAANIFHPGIVDVLDAFSTTKNKTSRNIGGFAGSVRNISIYSGVWLSTASITSMEISTSIANFVAGSRFSLYGIRG
jgi:hypothetical protein